MRWYDPGGDIAMPRTVSIMTSRMVLSIFNIPPVLGAMSPIARLPRYHKIVKLSLRGLVTSAIKYLDRSLNCFPRACDLGSRLVLEAGRLGRDAGQDRGLAWNGRQGKVW
jgi:hypothetical protein